MPLLRKRKLTIERHETTTTVRIVAEDTAPEIPAPVEPAAWETWTDELDPRCPVEPDAASPLFWQALRPYWSHSSAFALAESERAGKLAARRQEVPRRTGPSPVPYPGLAEDTLAGEFAARPDDRLVTTAWAETPLELTPGRST